MDDDADAVTSSGKVLLPEGDAFLESETAADALQVTSPETEATAEFDDILVSIAAKIIPSLNQNQNHYTEAGKPMGFFDDDATWERFQKRPHSNVTLQRCASSMSRNTSSHQRDSTSGLGVRKSAYSEISQTPQLHAATSSFSALTTGATDNGFVRKGKGLGIATKGADWLPLNSMWSTRKFLSREDVQVTLYATAEILAGANTATSFSAVKKLQLAQDDSANFKSMVINDTATPLRIFEIADRLASGGIIDTEVDMPIIAWFLRLIASCPNMTNEEIPVDAEGVFVGQANTIHQRNEEEDVVNRSLMNNDQLKEKIEADDILAMMTAKAESDGKNVNTFEGDLRVSIVPDETISGETPITFVKDVALNGNNLNTDTYLDNLISNKGQKKTWKEAKVLKIHVHDDFGNLTVIPATPAITINEIKKEVLRRRGIVEMIDCHDIVGVDNNDADVHLDYINQPIGYTLTAGRHRESSATYMKFRIRRKKPISWSIPVYIYEKDVFRQISVDSFTLVEEVVAAIAHLENMDETVRDEYGIFNNQKLIVASSTFDPWEEIQEFVYTHKSDPFPTKEEMAAPDFRQRPLEPPQTETTRNGRPSPTDAGLSNSGKPRIVLQEENSNLAKFLQNQSVASDLTPKVQRSLKSRLFGGFSGLKATEDSEEEGREVQRRHSSIVMPFTSSSNDKKSGSGNQIDFVARFYYGNMAYTTLKLPVNATCGTAISAIMEKLLIKEPAEEYSIFLQRLAFDGMQDLERNQEIYAIYKTLSEGELFLFKRRNKIETHLRSENSGIRRSQFDLATSHEVKAFLNVPGADDANEDFVTRPSLTRLVSKSVQLLKSKAEWTQTEEVQELCKVLGYVGKQKEVHSDILKPKKHSHQEVPKEGWLLIRDEFEEWVDVWVSVNAIEVKMLLSSLDATTYIIPIEQCATYIRQGPEIGHMHNTFIIEEVGKASHTIAAKSFSEMDEWISRIKSFISIKVGPEPQPVSQSTPESLEDCSPFILCRILGDEESRRVLLCKQKSTHRAFAVKMVAKKTTDKTALEMEAKVLKTVHHPFIVRLHAAFESPSHLFFVMDYIDCGELYNQIATFGKFTEDRARFYSAEILLGLESLHGHRIVYRDLQLENILMSRDGHVVLADFGLSRMETNADAGLAVGPLEYQAPEIIYGQGSSFATDWWAFGIILFEMMTGNHPFYSSERSQMETNICQSTIKWPKHLSANAKSLLSGLTARDASQRLGSSSGGEEILRHHFYAKLDIAKIATKSIDPPYKPEVVDSDVLDLN